MATRAFMINCWSATAIATMAIMHLSGVQAAADPQSPPTPAAPTFTNYGGIPWAIAVVPKSAPAGTPRTIVVTGSCPSAFTLDQSVAGTLGVRLAPGGACPPGPVPSGSVTFTSNTVGSLRVTLLFPGDAATIAETSLVTTAGARPKSTVNLSGMWYDPATDGSGISFHHNPASDSIFGTWFMYGVTTAPRQGSRWFSLQGFQWLEGGAVLEGLALEATGRSAQCEIANSCPRAADGVNFRASVRVTIRDANNAKIEAFDVFGTSLFVSNLRRLVF